MVFPKMKAKKIISLVLASLFLLAISAVCISCDNGDDQGNNGDKITVSVEVYYTDSDGAESIFLKAAELQVDAGSTVNDTLIALVTAREGTYKALADGSVDSITFDGETLAQKSETVSSTEDSKTFKNTHFDWTLNGAKPDDATSLTLTVSNGDKIVYKLVTEEQVVPVS